MVVNKLGASATVPFAGRLFVAQGTACHAQSVLRTVEGDGYPVEIVTFPQRFTNGRGDGVYVFSKGDLADFKALPRPIPPAHDTEATPDPRHRMMHLLTTVSATQWDEGVPLPKAMGKIKKALAVDRFEKLNG